MSTTDDDAEGAAISVTSTFDDFAEDCCPSVRDEAGLCRGAA